MSENNSKGWIEKYRPKRLSEVAGQQKVVKELAKRIKENSLRQNMLFSGGSGVGKTTIAKIIAKTINCKSPNIDTVQGVEHFIPCEGCSPCQKANSEQSGADFHFFDGSELNKDKILELKNLCLAPPMYGKARIIFIDEIQNIASGRDSTMQTLLKIIEHDYKGQVFFIMSTMDIKKINKAVIDRFHSHFKLKSVKPADLVSVAERILTEEGLLNDIDLEQINFYKEGLPVFLREGLQVVASCSNGCVREFIGHLETCVYRELYTEEEILDGLEIISPFKAVTLIKQIIRKDKEFFNDIDTFEGNTEEFFKLSYSILADMAVFLFTGKVRIAWQESQFEAFTNYKKEILDLVIIHKNIHESLNGYFNYSVYVSHLLNYMFNETKVQVNNTVSKPVEQAPRRRRG